MSTNDPIEPLEGFLDRVRERNPNEDEFHQAVAEVMEHVYPLVCDNAAWRRANLPDRIVEPDRVISFQVCWETDEGEVRVNRGYRVQFNGAIGPYKGGLRFHPTVTPSVLKFLGFEQTFKNALTDLPMGGAKGGSDFDPEGRSEHEIMRFCQAFMTQLYDHIGPDRDVPAGDINVGTREIGYLFGAYRRLTRSFHGVLTGKGLCFSGSELRTEATGYGLVYFLCNLLRAHDLEMEGCTVCVSGAGNVATHAIEKAIGLGARVVTLSDSSGFIHDPDGLSQEKIDWIRAEKAKPDGTLKGYTDKFGGDWHADERPWQVTCDVALPCATQNEMNADDVGHLVENGCKVIAEGANMPLTADARRSAREAGIIHAPGKAANAGGVAMSGLELSQNAMRRSSDRDDLDANLRAIMARIHDQCAEAAGCEDGVIDYARGADIAAFRKVAHAMAAQGF